MKTLCLCIISISIVIYIFFIIPGQSFALQACVSVLFPIQSFPQSSARIRMLLLRVCIPSPQFAELFPIHSFPQSSARIRMLRLRVCIPSPQFAEQLLHSPKVLHLQSTGTGIATKILQRSTGTRAHWGFAGSILSISIAISVFFIIPGQSLALQACVSVLFSIQSFPQFSARINMLLLRVCIPSPQLAEQLLHPPNVLHLQSTGAVIKTKSRNVALELNFYWLNVDNVMTSYLGFRMVLSSVQVGHMVFLRRAPAVFLSYFFLWCHFHTLQSNCQLSMDPTRNPLKI